MPPARRLATSCVWLLIAVLILGALALVLFGSWLPYPGYRPW